ncbi:hypothetical protein QYF36_016413 [Acer negundo]|nr:hypothetical protein QYF36_016413 [Acer negundo]
MLIYRRTTIVNNITTAKWTMLALGKPLIDAIYMVDMFTLVKNSTPVSILEILHTYNTITILLADSFMTIVEDRVSYDGFPWTANLFLVCAAAA